MTKNRIAFKLSLYFGVTLLVFSLIIGGIFLYFFKNHTVKNSRNELIDRAVSIADTLSVYMEKDSGSGSGYGIYLRFINDIAGADAWVIDKDLNLIIPKGNNMGMGTHDDITYADLPINAEELISEVFEDKQVISEDFSDILTQPTLTVGVPVKISSGEIIGVVLLHSPINGTSQAIKSGMYILALSLIIGLILSFILSFVLSKNFTDPIILKEAENAVKLEKSRSDFITNISHELKTPVTVIRGSLETLNDKVVTDPIMVDEYIKQMLEESKYLQRLVNDLLDLSKLQNSDFVINKKEILLCDVIDEVIRSAEKIAKEKNIVIDIEKDDFCKINGDYERLRQMFLIIMDNAVKFSYPNSHIKVSLLNNILTIKDFGIGISKEDLPYIFDRFHKTQTEQNKSGTGLGLAIAKQIATRHDITIQVNSIEGTGTEFIFILPEKT